MSDRDRSSPSLTDTPLKTYIGRHDDDYPLINGNGWDGAGCRGVAPAYFPAATVATQHQTRLNRNIHCAPHTTVITDYPTRIVSLAVVTSSR